MSANAPDDPGAPGESDPSVGRGVIGGARLVPLPSPEVELGREYLARVERLVPRVRAARERREGPGRGGLQGGGLEFVGYRAYRSGESLREIDWSLFARLDRPFVRMSRREASERWAILLDTSASMGVGEPGKLQAGAEVAGALASLGLAHGAQVALWSAGDAPREARKPTDFPGLLGALNDLVAHGEDGLAPLLQNPGRIRDAGRVFVIGDLMDLRPVDVLGRLARRGRELGCIQILAPEELSASTESLGESVVWADAESGERQPMELSRAACDAYEIALQRRLTAWSTACARHRAWYGSWSSAAAFEDICAAMVGA